MSQYYYRSSFVSVDSHIWTAMIIRNVDDGIDDYEVVAEGFSFDLEAVRISWPQTEKWQPLQGAQCTLRVVSPADRTFIDLYASRPGDVVLRLSRDGTLWWTGTLDAEFYEEPYTAASGYEVELTFSDLGALEYLAYSRSGDTPGRSVPDILRCALRAASLPETIDFRHALRTTAGAAVDLEDITVAQDNFIDEDGEPMTWKEAVAGVLQPLGLRIVQEEGRFTVYDLYSARAAAALPLQWTADDATLGTDKVYNDISVEFSSYGDATVATCEVDADKLTMPSPAGLIYRRTDSDDSYDSFTVWTAGGTSAPLPALIAGGQGFFYRMERNYGGEDGAGIGSTLVFRNTGGTDSVVGAQGTAVVGGHTANLLGNAEVTGLYRAVERHMAPPGDYPDALMRISLRVLLDSRYNPFESAGDGNRKKDYENQEKRWNIVYVPVRIWLDADDGTTLAYYNEGVCRSTSFLAQVENVLGGAGWLSCQAGGPAWGSAWLVYYDHSDRGEKSPCSGWMTNRQCIGGYFGSLPEWWDKRGQGEFMPLPHKPGTLHVEVGQGVYIWSLAMSHTPNLTPAITPRWLLYGKMDVELTDIYGRTISPDDISHSATLDSASRSGLKIPTVCGSCHGTLPTSRGVMMMGGKALGRLSRGALTAYPERLLIAAVASQYDRRHTVLQGTVAAASFAMSRPVTDAAQPDGEIFLADQADYDVRAAEVTARFSELSPQYYTPTS